MLKSAVNFWQNGIMKDLNLSSTQSYVTPAPERYAGKKSKFLSAAVLRAAVCKYRELAVKTEIFDFFIFCQEKPFGDLFTKITIKLSKDFLFSRNPQKSKMPFSGHNRH